MQFSIFKMIFKNNFEYRFPKMQTRSFLEPKSVFPVWNNIPNCIHETYKVTCIDHYNFSLIVRC